MRVTGNVMMRKRAAGLGQGNEHQEQKKTHNARKGPSRGSPVGLAEHSLGVPGGKYLNWAF